MSLNLSSTGAIFHAHPEAVSQLLSDIQRGHLAIPNFQRDFVWEPDNTIKLIASILARYPAGSLLLWQAPAEALDPREFTGAKKIKKDQVERLVLDGQQRLTAIFRVVMGVTEETYFVDLAQLVDRKRWVPFGGDLINWDTVVSFKEQTAREKRKKLPAEHASAAWQFAKLKFPVNLVTSFDSWLDDFLKTLSAREASKARVALRRTRDDHLNQLLAYQFPVVVLPRATSLTAVCRIFETLNNTGEPLTPFELLTARFMPKGVNLRQMLEQSETDHPVVFSKQAGFSIDAYSILQAVCLRALSSAQRSTIMNELSAAQADRYWDDVVAGMEAAIEFVRNECGVLVRDWLPYSMVLVPMAAAWDRVEAVSRIQRAKRTAKMAKFFWSTVFTMNYDQGANSQAQADYVALTKWLEDDNAPLPEAVGALPISAETLLTATVRRTALYRGVMALALRNGARDFHTGEKLTMMRIRQEKIDAHHIFPKKALESEIASSGLSSELILNRALIDASTNRSIGKRKPSIYLAAIKSEAASDLDDVLESHLIDAAPMYKDKYSEFVLSRLAVVTAMIETVTGKRVVPLEATVPSARRSRSARRPRARG